MAHSIVWVEELLSWISSETVGAEAKVESVVDPDRWVTSQALGLTAINPRFFKDLQVLKDSLNTAHELASELAANIDQYLAIQAGDWEEDECKTCELPQSQCNCE